MDFFLPSANEDKFHGNFKKLLKNNKLSQALLINGLKDLLIEITNQ